MLGVVLIRLAPERVEEDAHLGHHLETQQQLPGAFCHAAAVPAFLLHLREPAREGIREELAAVRLERAVGVVYRPDTELESHYFQASLPSQFDAWLWFDVTCAVTALPSPVHAEVLAP